MTVDLRLAPAERAPEVVDVCARGARDPDVDREQRGFSRDDHRDRAGALRRLAGGADAVARDVGADHERAAAPPAPDAIHSTAAISPAVPP